jgi:hypothetical protein
MACNLFYVLVLYKKVRLFPLALTLALFDVSLCRSQTNGVPASQSDAEIRQKIVGTWVTGRSFTSTNKLESSSWFQMLTFMTNGCYSATQTVESAGTIRIETCQGYWSVQDHFLTYSATNSVGVRPDTEPFFYPQAKVIRVNKKQLCLFEWMDQLCWFQRVSPPSGSVDSFRFIDRSTTVQQLEARVGPPDMVVEVSPGHDILIYNLADDTSIAIEAESSSRILQVQHGQTTLFKQPWLPVDSWMKR